MAALKKHRRRQKTDGLYRADGLVFCNRTGTLLNPSNVRNRSFRPLLDRAGLAKISFHAATRHTAATLLLGRNAHPKIVQEMLGHSTVKLTLDTYSHLLPGMADGAVDAMRDALEGDGPGEELEGTVPPDEA
jgi:integrase